MNIWKRLIIGCIVFAGIIFLLPTSVIVSQATQKDSQITPIDDESQIQLELTKEEKAYVDSAGEITVGQLRNRYPVSNLNESTGELSGINEDILNLIAKLSGLTLVSKPIALDEKPMDALKKGKFDVVMGVLQTEHFLKDKELQMSDPFIESTMAVVMRNGETFSSDKKYTVALKSSFQAMQEYIMETYPNYETKFYSTDEECFFALQHGEVDLMMQNVYVTSYLLQKPQYSDLQILPTTFLTEKNCIATTAATDTRLISIINKSIQAITTQQLNEVILANTTAKPYKLTLQDVFYKYRVQIVAFAILIILCIVLLICIILIRQRNLRVTEEKNAQLSDAVAQAEHANAAKGEFLSRMSHEIRTPMNAIVGITTIARQYKNDPERIDDYLAKIAISSKVLLNIINDVLDMSAIENEKLKIAKAEFDIKQILTEISTMYYTQCKDKGIRFVMATDLEDEILIGDSLRVNQILLNLVSNAFKFTDTGGEIKVLAKEIARKDNIIFIRFSVSDNGCGMSEEMQNRLFKPFEQENATTAQKHGGSGLGMSIAKNLVDLMQGDIRVESKVGQGTMFTVDLPFESTGEVSAGDSTQIKHLRALVVDDDPSAREYTSIVLKRIGLQYDTADSGMMALEKIKTYMEEQEPYDVCFIDWKMAGMNGLELTKKIRQSMDNEPLIIIVSAYDLNEVEDEARIAGADMFVPKPLFQSTVFNLLMSLSGGRLKKESAAMDAFDFTGHKVLLAEDIEFNREIAVELLEMVHMKADCAVNGQEAVDMFAQSEPGTYDAILMDVQMPVMDGYEATREIRKLSHPQAKSMPIYAMTANAFTEDVSAALGAGMNGHIAKPIDTQILYETLQKAIDKAV